MHLCNLFSLQHLEGLQLRTLELRDQIGIVTDILSVQFIAFRRSLAQQVDKTVECHVGGVTRGYLHCVA